MAERVLNALIDEHIALLAEAREARDHWKQHAADLSKWLSDAQDDNADLLAALEAITDRFEETLCATHATRTDRQEIKEARAAIAKARDNG